MLTNYLQRQNFPNFIAKKIRIFKWCPFTRTSHKNYENSKPTCSPVRSASLIDSGLNGGQGQFPCRWGDDYRCSLYDWNMKAYSSINIIDRVENDRVSHIVQSQGQVAGLEESASSCIRQVDSSVNNFRDVVLEFLIPMRSSIMNHVTNKQIFGFVPG